MKTPTLHVDFETRSTADLKKVGLWNYAKDPSTEVVCMAWSFGGEPEIWTPGQPLPADVQSHVLNRYPIVAHNVQFERLIWNKVMFERFGWPSISIEQCRCTMVGAYSMGLPGTLEDAALAMGLRVRKDMEGRNLMLRMARPRRMEGGKPIWWDDEERLARLYEYCKQDVRVEIALYERLMPLSDYETKIWHIDQYINTRGVEVDVLSIYAAAEAALRIKERAGRDLARLTGGHVTSVSALAALKGWLATQGIHTESVSKEAVADLLSLKDLPGVVREVLELRAEVGKASVAKLDKILDLVGSDSRLHNMFQYWGAHTGRWAGRGVQPHNFIRDVPDAEDVESIMELLRAGQLDEIELFYGPPMTVISRCLRSFFWAKEGFDLLAGDFSAVEGRGVAWFCGEQWKLDAFKAADEGRGPGIYEMTAAKIFGKRVEEITKPERFIGKVCELAFGYQGGVGAARNFLPSDTTVDDPTIDSWKHSWRTVHPRVRATWYELEKAAINAVKCPGEAFEAGFPGRNVTYKLVGSFLWCKLPSGRCLCYPYPRILPGKYGEQLTYMTVPSDNDRKRGTLIHCKEDGDVYSNVWARVATYGGSLLENVVQAICRDLLADCIRRLEEDTLPVVLHVHDEIVVETDSRYAPQGQKDMEKIMNSVPEWAEGFPLHTKVDRMKRYGK